MEVLMIYVYKSLVVKNGYEFFTGFCAAEYFVRLVGSLGRISAGDINGLGHTLKDYVETLVNSGDKRTTVHITFIPPADIVCQKDQNSIKCVRFSETEQEEFCRAFMMEVPLYQGNTLLTDKSQSVSVDEGDTLLLKH